MIPLQLPDHGPVSPDESSHCKQVCPNKSNRHSAGSSVGKAQVLVFGELCRSRSAQSCWGFSRGFGWRRVCGGLHHRGGFYAPLGGLIGVLLGHNLQQGGCHTGADVLVGLGIGGSETRWRWRSWRRGRPQVRGGRSLVVHGLLPFGQRTIWRKQRQGERALEVIQQEHAALCKQTRIYVNDFLTFATRWRQRALNRKLQTPHDKLRGKMEIVCLFVLYTNNFYNWKVSAGIYWRESFFKTVKKNHSAIYFHSAKDKKLRPI